MSARTALVTAALALAVVPAPARARPGGGSSFKASDRPAPSPVSSPSTDAHAPSAHAPGARPSAPDRDHDDDRSGGISDIANRFVEDMPPPPQCAPPPPGAVPRGSDWVMPDGSVLPRGAACSPEDQAVVEDYRALAYSIFAILGELFLLVFASAHDGLRRRLYELAAIALVAVPIHGGFNVWLSIAAWAVLPAFSYFAGPPRKRRKQPWEEA